jgi:thioredoxin 1
MSKFGELIDVNIPVLLDFFTDWNEQSETMHAVLRDVAAALGDKAKVIKIDVDKNNFWLYKVTHKNKYLNFV